jgi:hypothetical protein
LETQAADPIGEQAAARARDRAHAQAEEVVDDWISIRKALEARGYNTEPVLENVAAILVSVLRKHR